MKWAAVSLVALSALCMPTALQAQDFTADSVKKALTGFSGALRQSSCFIGRDFRPFQIAVAQMESTKFTDSQLDTISEWVEEALQSDPFFAVAAQRRHWELEEIGKALQEAKSPTAKDPLEAIITIEAGAGNTIRVTAFAYANGRRCQAATQSFAAGRIAETPDVPEKFFERAAAKLPDKTVEQLVVMPSDVNVGSSINARAVLGQRLQEQLADAIKQVLQARARRSAGNPVPSVVQTYTSGMDVSHAWQAQVRARRSPQGGVEVTVDFRAPPGSQEGSVFDRGYLSAEIIPPDTDQAVVDFAEAACRTVEQALDRQTDPDALHAIARDGQCARLGQALAAKEEFHRQRICNEDRAHWREAMTGPVEALDSAAGTLRCKQVADDAQKELQQRKKQEAAIADMKSTAVDLGILTDGVTVERKAVVGGVAGVWKVQMTEADTLEAQLDDLSATANTNIGVDVFDSNWKRVEIKPTRNTPQLKEIASPRRLPPGVYYIYVEMKDARQSAFTLRVAKGWIDTAGDTIETARDLGSLGAGTQTLRKHIGGADRGDVYKFTVQEPLRLQVAAADLTSDVQIELMDRNGQVIQSSSGRDRQNVGGSLEARSTYYVAVRAAGGITPYALSIGLSKIAPVAPIAPVGPAPFSRPEIAAQASIGGVSAPEAAGGAPSTLKHAVTRNDPEYWARFSVKAPTLVAVELTWQDRQAELHLGLYKEEGNRRLFQKQSVAENTVNQKVSDLLDPGTYLIRVKHDKGSSAETPFTLNLRREALKPADVSPKPDEAAAKPDTSPKPNDPPKPVGALPPKPLVSPPPKPVKEAASSPAIGNEPVVYTLPANVNEYSASFSLTERTNVTAVLSWSDRAVDLEMALSDASGKPIVATTGTIPGRTIDQVLEPGTYTVRVYRSLPTSKAAVPLRLTLNRAPPLPPARSSSSQQPQRR